MAIENEQDVDLNNDASDEIDEVEADEIESTAQPKAQPKRTPEEQLAYLEGRTQRLRKKLGLVEARKPKEESKPTGLDKADIAYLAAKGYDHEEDIEYLEKYSLKWELPVRELLKDEDVQAKLKHNKIEREVKSATPSSTKRSAGGEINNLDYHVAKYERTGEYPADFKLKSAVINALVEREAPTTPPWRR